MCLALPVRLSQIDPDGYGLIELGGVTKRISLTLIEQPAIGDYVILHVGYALTKLDRAEAEHTLRLLAELAASQQQETRALTPQTAHLSANSVCD
ncbi:MAG: HypC/HybG/HupF family hydrogenase formation chaperone [Paludibacterium sp.]|uniref:HypC/HybG/HupF family hydrogenase formation chaperone n=1 Tax=Paludibacterium sp. TaxID=1917523 RepID=UPI0025F26593|nr:HypC/HybG/HupF family hydrogenase formation chaperone [Paludibacterium sp.]MBV8046489.1 HypC/HybG/HupF family hydrogenase formation chaperone [Paludibacterium sp.]MBV8646557.1 HypC/HybG/HupF family hydrogenase formation chaperone [Paludibacterium sp.]